MDILTASTLEEAMYVTAVVFSVEYCGYAFFVPRALALSHAYCLVPAVPSLLSLHISRIGLESVFSSSILLETQVHMLLFRLCVKSYAITIQPIYNC
jgi:hypothetical protein